MDQVQEERSPARLPVVGILTEAIGTIVNQRKKIAIALAIPFFIALWFQLYGVYVLNIDPDAGHTWINFVSMFLFAVAAVTCHRIVLLGPDSVAEFGTKATENYFWRYILRCIVMGMTLFVLIIPFALILPPLVGLLDIGNDSQTIIKRVVGFVVAVPLVSPSGMVKPLAFRRRKV